MAKAKLKNGDLLRITLPKELGFAFAKYIDLLEINPAARYPALLRIYNYRSTSVTDIIPDSKKGELLFSPLLVAGAVPAFKNGWWIQVNNESVEPHEEIIPHYKLPDPLLLTEEENAKEWYYVLDADKFSEKIKSTYEAVKHLETLSATGSELIGTKIAMGLLQQEGKEIRDYFAVEEFFEKLYYSEVTKIPAYFSQPTHMQGRALNS